MARKATKTIANAKRPTDELGVSVNGAPLRQHAAGGYEAADSHSRELMSWRPSMVSPDLQINGPKPIMDARGRDMVRNSGVVSGAVSIHRDSIVGAQFTLNAKPDYRILGMDDKWADEFQQEVEAKFTLYAESNDCWLDASRMNTLTGLVRMAIGGFVPTGEVLSSVEFMKGVQRPYRTAIQMIDTDRLSNPRDSMDTAFLRRGVERDRFGAPQAYHIRTAHPSDGVFNQNVYNWTRVPVRKPWGRLQMIHIIEAMRPDQTRGVAEMVAVLKEMQMTKKFHELVLQKAVLQASFAAAIESELPPDQAFEAIGVSNGENKMSYAESLLEAIGQYTQGSRNLQLDGVKIPHLFPGTKLNLLPVGQPGGVGTSFEESLLRHIAAALGLSYEQFSRDYTKTNYSSARASGNETWKYMQARKKVVADRFAGIIYSLWLEEAINTSQLESMKGANAPDFYVGQNKDALCKCTWIGASRGQVDELKETQAAVLRINAGLSTREIESARLGNDFREIFSQISREQKLAESLDITFDNGATKPGTMSSQRGDAAASDAAASAAASAEAAAESLEAIQTMIEGFKPEAEVAHANE